MSADPSSAGPSAAKRTRRGNDDAVRQRKPSDLLSKDCWARSQSEIVELNFKWTVEHFSFKTEGLGERICSPEFSSGNDEHTVFRLDLFPRGDHESRGSVAVTITRVSKSMNAALVPVSAQCQLILLNSQQEILKSYKFPIQKFDAHKTQLGKAHLDRQLIEADKLQPTDELHIHCQIRYETKKTIATGSTPLISINASTAAASLTKRFQHIFNEGMEFSDMEIRARGVAFPAHRVVLAAGSPVFSAMLQSEGFIEKKTNILQIDDLEPPVVKEMLRFLYTDRVEKMDELAKDLLVAADKYLIDLLKLQCQVALAKTLTVENCSEILALADSHSAVDLKAVAIEFVLQRASDVMKSDGWKELKRTHSQLGFEVSEALMTRIQPESQQPVAPQTLSPLRLAPSDGHPPRRHVNFNVPQSMMPRIVLPRLDATNPYVGPLFRSRNLPLEILSSSDEDDAMNPFLGLDRLDRIELPSALANRARRVHLPQTAQRGRGSHH